MNDVTSKNSYKSWILEVEHRDVYNTDKDEDIILVLSIISMI